jgi:excisionase family DNA binding protein
MLSLAEASSLLNVSEVTVKRWAREHLLKSVKQGADFLFPEPDVLKYKEINDKLIK